MTLYDIDTSLIATRKQIQTICRNLKFEHVIDFKQNISNEEIINLKPNLNKINGIYFFEMKVDVNQDYNVWRTQFENDWDKLPNGMKHTPTSKKIRLDEHKELKEWMPLYIGKRNDLYDRIKSHICLTYAATTFGIKFRERANFANTEFRVRVIRLNVTNYDMIAPVVEDYFREIHHPVVGKK